MTHDIHVNFPHITRVEGHGNIVLNVKDGKIEELRLEIVESPRFFEVMLKGRHLDEAPGITSRICGICAISHTLASIKACEAVLGITPSPEVIALRKVLLNAEILQSHILHLGLLVLPDFFKLGSALELSKEQPELVKTALRIKSAANEVAALLAGRHVHPIGMTIGGFAKWPAKKTLSKVKSVWEGAARDLEDVVAAFKALTSPKLERKSNYASFKDTQEYALYDGMLHTSSGKTLPASNYRELLTEEVVAYSTAKRSRVDGNTIMVGALARVNNNYDLLCSEAKSVAEEIKLRKPSFDPFDNNTAQLIECVHTAYNSISILDNELKNVKPVSPPGKITLKAGKGVGVVEAPRGTLYHEYETDSGGHIINSNCIIPTAQNLANIEKDIEAFVPGLLKMPKDDIGRSLEMLVRAYDPCISCSTHFLEVKFVE